MLSFREYNPKTSVCKSFYIQHNRKDMQGAPHLMCIIKYKPCEELTHSNDRIQHPRAMPNRTLRVRRGLPATTWVVLSHTVSTTENPPRVFTTWRTVCCFLRQTQPNEHACTHTLTNTQKKEIWRCVHIMEEVYLPEGIQKGQYAQFYFKKGDIEPMKQDTHTKKWVPAFLQKMVNGLLTLWACSSWLVFFWSAINKGGKILN